MLALDGKNALVIGCTGGVGQSITASLMQAGARVTGVARNAQRLADLQRELPGLVTAVADLCDADAASQLLAANDYDLLVSALGETPTMAPVSEQSWQSFSSVWDNDMQASFHLCRAVLRQPLKAGSHCILISGGPGVGASPLSGGLSPTKNGQLFLAETCQWESERSAMGVRFITLAPKRVMPTTALGTVAAQGYADFLGMSVAEFMGSQTDAQRADEVGPAVLSLLSDDEYAQGCKFMLTAEGISAIA